MIYLYSPHGQHKTAKDNRTKTTVTVNRQENYGSVEGPQEKIFVFRNYELSYFVNRNYEIKIRDYEIRNFRVRVRFRI